MLELATAKDWPKVCRLAVQLHDLHVRWRPDIYFRTEEPYPKTDFEQDVLKRLVYVAKLDQSVVGYVVLSVQRKEVPGIRVKKHMLIKCICVDEVLRGHGLGTMMVEDVKALARAFGCDGLLLGVHPENDSAVGFYQKCGLTIRTLRMEMDL